MDPSTPPSGSDGADPHPSRSSSLSGRLAPFAVLAIVLAATAAARWRLLDVPLERDEGEFAYMGRLILEGEPLYKEAANMKWPGTYLAYAAGMAAFGETARGVHLTLLATNLLSIVLVFLIGGRIAGPYAASTSAAAFAAMTFSPHMSGFSAHASDFVVAAMLLGLWILLKALDRPTTPLWALGLSGFWFGAAAVMKQPGLAYLGLAGAALLEAEWVHRPFRAGRLLGRGFILALGAAAALGGAAAWIYASGAWEEFWFWTVEYARHYGQPWDARESPRALWIAARTFFVRDNQTLVALSLLGLLAPWWTPSLGSRRLLCLALPLFGLLAVCPGAVFRNHYFIFLTPAAAILAGVGLASLVEWTPFVRSPKTREDLAMAIGALAVLWPVYNHAYWVLDVDPEKFATTAYRENPFNEAAEIAEFLRRRTGPEDRIGMLGSESEILFYAGRRSAAEFLHVYPLMERHPYARRMQERLIQSIEDARPKYIVWVSVAMSWLQRPDSDARIFEWAKDYLEKHYRLAAYLSLDKETPPKLVEGKEVEDFPWRSSPPRSILIFERIPD
jgi:hypothetical protein